MTRRRPHDRTTTDRRVRFDPDEHPVSAEESGADKENPPVRPYSAEKARQGTVILTTRAKRIVFAVGLVSALALAIALVAIFSVDRV